MEEPWRLTATWMSGKTWQFDIPPTSAISKLRRLVMLASGSMQRRVIMVVADTPLEGDNEPLSYFLEQGLRDGAQLTIVVLESVEHAARADLTNAELAAFAVQCAVLEVEHMKLKFCSQVTDEGVVPLCTSCPNLRGINVSFCQQVGDESLRALGTRCRNLQNIHLVACWRVSDEGLRALGEVCADLQKIILGDAEIEDDVEGNGDVVGDEGVRALSRRSRSLENLCRRGGGWIRANKVSDEGLRILSEGCRN